MVLVREAGMHHGRPSTSRTEPGPTFEGYGRGLFNSGGIGGPHEILRAGARGGGTRKGLARFTSDQFAAFSAFVQVPIDGFGVGQCTLLGIW